MKLFCKIALLCVALFLLANFTFAQSERENGIKLYKEGKYKEAVAELEKASKENKKDAEIWNYLGLAFFNIKDYVKSVKAFDGAIEINPQSASYITNRAYAYLRGGGLIQARRDSGRAIELDGKNATAYFIRSIANFRGGKIENAMEDIDKSITLNSDYAAAYGHKADILLAGFGKDTEKSKPIINIDLLKRAKDVLESCAKNCSNNAQKEYQVKRIEGLSAFYEYFKENGNAELNVITDENRNIANPNTTDDNINPVVITAMPRIRVDRKYIIVLNPSLVGRIIPYKIQVAALFDATGSVSQALVVKGDRSNLDLNDNAIIAALQIKFQPATKDGKPISQVIIIEYKGESGRLGNIN